MKSIICILVSSLFIGSASMGNVCRDNNFDFQDNSFFSHNARTDDFVPYPWGAELPFPWINVQGLWVANIGSIQAYYTFEVVGSSYSKDKQLLVKQYDARNCEIVSIGVGIENENKTIWAHMKPMFLPKPYRLGLRNFSAEALPKNLPNSNGRVMVMSVSTFGSLKSHHYPLQKVNNPAQSPLAACRWPRQ